MTFIIAQADSQHMPLADESVQCVVTSPPYWGLRDYGVEGQLGLEPTPDAYVANLVAVFREVRRVLRQDGTVWLNLGDSYAGSGRGLMGDGTPSDRGTAKQGTNRGTTNGKRNRRTVWTIATEPYKGAHFATMPTKLVEPCILAGSRPGDVVLDPFAGSGTVGVVALRHGRAFVGLDLSRVYCQMARRRIVGDMPILHSAVGARAI